MKFRNYVDERLVVTVIITELGVTKQRQRGQISLEYKQISNARKALGRIQACKFERFKIPLYKMGLEWEALICMFYFRQYLGICIKFTVRGLHYNPCGTEMMSSTPHEAQSVQIVTALVILHMKI